MLRSHFGIQRHPFDHEELQLLPHQQEVLDILLVHSQQGGLCLLLGEPGSGKSTLKEALCRHDPKRLVTPLVNRTLHTYHNTLRILCHAFAIEFSGRDHHCERQLVTEAFRLHRTKQMVVPIIDDAHLMPPFPCKFHNSSADPFAFSSKYNHSSAKYDGILRSKFGRLYDLNSAGNTKIIQTSLP